MESTPSFIERGRITGLQATVIAICALMNMLDGMDVLVISYAAPSLSDAWSITPGTLGTVFSAGLLGMALGAMFLAPFADRFGRRRMVLTCIVIMGLGTLLTAWVQSVWQLIALRVLSGLGIGAMLATSATVAAEYLPVRYRNLVVSWVFAGYPLGAVLSGLVAAVIVPDYGWPSIFVFAGIVTLLTFVPVAWLLPESLEFLLKTRPPGALEAANRILSRAGQAALAELPDPPVREEVRRASVSELFAPMRRNSTSWLWAAFFTSFATLYFLTSWIPKLASNTGLTIELAIYAGTVFNLGAFVGILSQGYMSHRLGLKRAISSFFVATAVLMVAFGFWSDPLVILLMFGLIGFGSQGGFVGLYAVAAHLYPTEIRNTGIGWGIGAGRVGAIVGPKIGGTLVGMGLSMTANFIIFALPMVIAAIATLKVADEPR